MMNEEETNKPFSVFLTAAEELKMRSRPEFEYEYAQMSSLSGRVAHVVGLASPYIVTLTHHDGGATEHAFTTMRLAEAFVRRNTPPPGPALATTYDRPAPNSTEQPAHGDSTMNDETILARLKVIDTRLRQISTDDAASVLAGGLASAGIHEQERLRLIAETERILDELDGQNLD